MTHLDPTAGANHEPEPDDPMADQLGADVRRAANDAREAVRLVAHLTLGAPALPAPEVYFALADLERLGHGLAQALRQLGVSLQRSLDASTSPRTRAPTPPMRSTAAYSSCCKPSPTPPTSASASAAALPPSPAKDTSAASPPSAASARTDP
jgi:hypothetical protein